MDRFTLPLSNVIIPKAVTTVTTPMIIGKIEAITVPKANNRTIMAIGNPMASADAKSFWLAVLMSAEITGPPVI